MKYKEILDKTNVIYNYLNINNDIKKVFKKWKKINYKIILLI